MDLEKNRIKPDEYIYKLIKSKIINRELFPNSHIVESQLSEETGISRTPIREALKRLSYEGLVTIIRNRGVFVSNPTIDEIRNLYECKKSLESAAIRKACMNITEKEINQLKKLVNEQTNAHKNKDLQEYIKYNDEFHLLIARASKNIFYEKYIKELIERSNVYLIFYDKFLFTEIDDSEALKHHHRIIKELELKNIEGCVETIDKHNQTTLDELGISGKGKGNDGMI